ncbi:probable ATP-dependent RNA helicase ddx5 isoform X2 [Punica granatum]|nr:probable ATP-dependent RNA helicase ddx5 isoform X2 [Punica granatum]
MAKGDDVIARKKNKANRKKLEKQGSSNVSARIASIIAAKKRRKAGNRRICQGMCFSLPTPDDPFNDRQGKKDPLVKDTKKKVRSQAVKAVHEKGSASGKGTAGNSDAKAANFGNGMGNSRPSKNERVKGTESVSNVGKDRFVDSGKTKQNGALENSGYPSKFLILCLKTIQDSLCHCDAENGEKISPFFVNAWGVEFWKLYATGMDILETSGTASSVEQIAWIVSTAADSIARREKEGLSFSSPSLLYLVPTREKASEVRNICKPLKALGIHTVSIHAGAALDHQIDGLKSCEPEFLVSIPERLLELISLKAVDISGISLLVIDGSLVEGRSQDMITSIKKFISGDHRTILFSNSDSGILKFDNILKGPIQKLSLDDSIASLNTCIKRLKT